MGAPMCGHLLAHGCDVTVHSRSASRARPLIDQGAAWAQSPAAAAADSEIVFIMVGHPRDVRDVVLGQDGVIAGARGHAVLVDMSTSSPELAREIAEAASARGMASVDAPVSGGDVGARNATLSIMVGGERDVVDRLRPLFGLLGNTIVHQGSAGAGQHTKMVNQILIASGMIGVCEALLYAYRAGLDLEQVLQSVGGGAAGSWSLANYAPRMLRNDLAPGFMVDHFIKDMEIALGEARGMDLALPGLALAHELYVSLRAHGGGRDGIQGLVRTLADLSAVQWEL
jgi:3-hydroxyisobutyrate dehydrogenase